MASVKTIKRKNCTCYQITFYRSGKRKYLSLSSKYTRKEVNNVLYLVEMILTSESTGCQLDKRTLSILDSVSDDLKKRLENVGLIQIRKSLTFENIFDLYWENEYYSFKPSTQSSKKQSRRRFFEFFSTDTVVADITKRDVNQFVLYLDRNLSEATRAGTIRDVRRVFNWAKENDMIQKNPFDCVTRGSFKNKKREYYVSMNDYEKMLDECPSKLWRVILALYRIGGLRKEEALLLTWSDIDFARGRILVHSPKTERFRGKGSRVIPMFPLLRKELEGLYNSLPEYSSNRIINLSRTAIDSHIERIIFLAGLNRWERLVQNLRSSRAIEVFEEFGELAESEWIGHSPKTAKEHYLHVLDSTFERAVSDNAVQDSTAKTAPKRVVEY